MESTPLKTDSDPDHKKPVKRKRAEAIGSIVIEPAAPAGPPPVAEQAKHENLWQQLIKRHEINDDEDDDESNDRQEGTSEDAKLDEQLPLETLSDDEREFALQKIAAERLEALAGEIPADVENENDYGEVSSEQAEAVMLETFYSKLLNSEPSAQAFSETLHEAGVPQDAIEPVDSELSAQAHEPAFGLPRLNNNEIPAPPLAGEAQPGSTKEVEPLEPDDAGAGASPPNIPPQGLGPEENPDSQLHMPSHLPRHDAAVEARPSAQSIESDEPRYTRSNVVGAALVGGIVGYFIGRRRGRIRTEKKLLPVQKKLEKQVEALGNDIFNKEVRLRKAAREHTYQQRQIIKMRESAAHNERLQPKAFALAAAENRVVSPNQERPRTLALEANQLHGKKHPAEKIGHVLVNAGSAPERGARPPQTEPKLHLASSQRIETMDRQALLNLSDKIEVNNTTLRRIYENHLIGEHGLRRLVEEYAHGGHVEKVLRQEMLERQIDFERDPVLRDRPKGADDKEPSPTLKKMLEKVDLSASSEQEAEAILAARHAYQTAEEHKAASRRRAVDVTLTGTILILLAVILLLILSR